MENNKEKQLLKLIQTLTKSEEAIYESKQSNTLRVIKKLLESEKF